MLRHGPRRHHRRRERNALDPRGQHRPRPDRAVAAARRCASGGDRLRRAVHAPGRARGRQARAPRGADGHMKFRRRSSVLPRAPWPNGLERTEPLRGQLWTRSERALRPPDVHWAWRGLSLATALLETALLAWLWFGPTLAVRSVEVTGAHHLSASQVAKAAG